jgi:hypothetical protein
VFLGAFGGEGGGDVAVGGDAEVDVLGPAGVAASAWAILLVAAVRLTLSPSASPVQPSRSASAMRAWRLSRISSRRWHWAGAMRRRGHLTQDYLDKFIPANHLKTGEHLKAPDGTAVTADGGTTPKVHDGWMWDLTVPGNNDHDFYIIPAVGSQASTQGQVYSATEEPVLVHNVSCPDIAAAASVAAKNAPKDATMTSVAGIKETDTAEIGYSGASSRPSYLEPEIEEAAQDGGQMFGGDAANCAEMRACNALFANHAADFEEEMGRPLDFSDIEFLTVRSKTGAAEAACLSCQSVLVRRGATDLSVGG